MRTRPLGRKTTGDPPTRGVFRSLAVGVALAFAAPASSSTPIRIPEPGAAVPLGPLANYVSEDDYPAAAIRSGAQGIVYFRLSVAPDGRVQGCAVTRSSGYDLLDSTTCRLMVRRVRFTPAIDPQGRPRVGEHEGYIEWRLPEPPLPQTPLPEPAVAALDLWSRCTWGEAARLALTTPNPAAVAERAIGACTDLEATAARELAASPDTRANAARILKTRKRDFLTMLTPYLERMRGILGAAQGR